jgi:hypothetical protein
MDAAMLQNSPRSGMGGVMSEIAGRVISATEFRELLVSHRQMVRADRRADRLRGLQDVETGEIFLTDERRLLEGRR